MARHPGPSPLARAILASAVFLLLQDLPGAGKAQVFDGIAWLGSNDENFAHLMHVSIVGTSAYVSEGLGTNGMETYDVSIPTQPIRIDEDGPATWRTRAYPQIDRLFGFGHQSGLGVYDISGPVTLLRSFDPAPGISYEGGALRGDLLYVAAHQIGIEILDVSDPGPVVRVGTIDLGENAAWDAEAVDGILLVANGRFGLSVVDIDAAPPAVLGALSLPGLSNDILVSGSHGYVSLGPDGLATLDLGNPANPILLDINRETAGNVTEISALGDLLVAGAWTRLELYSLTDPSAPARIGWDDTRTWAMGAALDDDPADPLVAVADWRGVLTYRPQPDPGPDVEVDPAKIDFGVVSAPEDSLVRVFNRGLGMLNVSDVLTPTGFTATPRVFAVPPGGVQEVLVTASGPATTRASIRFLSDDPDEPTTRVYVYKNNSGVFPQLGDPAPGFTLQGTDGQAHSLAAELGRVVFLEFGANW